MAIHCNGFTLPFSLYFEDINNKLYYIEELWSSEGQIQREKLTGLKENANIKLRFHADSEEDYDPEAVCKIQTSLFNSSNKEESFKFNLNKDGNNFSWIYRSKEKKEFPWRMGVYFLEISYKGEKYVGGIYISPLHLKDVQISDMHYYLSQQVEGLIYDFVYSNKSLSDTSDMDLPKYWYYEYSRNLELHYNDFLYAITNIIKNPKDRIIPKYNPSMKPGKTDQKSLRWSLTNRGISQMAGTNTQSQQLIKRKVTDYDTKENQWIKNILIIWKKDIQNVLAYIKNDVETLETKLFKLEAELSELQETRDKVKNKNNVGKSQVKSLNAQIYTRNKDMKKVRKHHMIIQNWIEVLKSTESKLVYYLNRTYLVDVTRGTRKPFLKKFHYYKIDDIYSDLIRIKEDDGEKNQRVSILKPTWQLYEYYCLFKILDLIKSSGYHLLEGVRQDLLSMYFEDRIPESSKFVFEKENTVLHVWYDHPHAHSESEAGKSGERFHIIESNNKPDIKIDAFRKIDGDIAFLGTTIFDAKFSKFTSLYNSQYSTETVEQLSKYRSFIYHGPKSRRGSSTVDEVICLYAGEKTSKVQRTHDSIHYINFLPNSDSENQPPIGELEVLGYIGELD